MCGWGWNAFLFRVVQSIKDQRVNHGWMCCSLQSLHSLWEDSGESSSNSLWWLLADGWGWRALKEFTTTLKGFLKKNTDENSLSKELKTGIFLGVECGRRAKKSKEIDPLPHGMWFGLVWRGKSGLCNLYTVGKALEAAFDKQSRTYPEIFFLIPN